MVRVIVNGRNERNAERRKTAQERKTTGCTPAVRHAILAVGAIITAAVLIGALAPPLWAQAYPNKPIRFILPMAPGGAADVLGRVVGQKFAELLGQSMVPDNRAGAGGNLGIELVAKSRPDGYTILLTTPAIAISPSLDTKLGYDPITEFAPISLIAEVPVVVVVKPALPVANLKELVEYARANPRKLHYGSTGVGGSAHLAGELLKSLVKIDLVHVPFKSAAPALIGVMGGEVEMALSTATAAAPQIQAGKVKALAVLSSKRLASLPNVPTAKEAGIDNWEVSVWYGMLAPAATPRDIVNRLNAEWIKIAAMPDTAGKLQAAGFETMTSTPEQFSEFLKAEITRWAKVIREANLTIN